MATGVRLQFNYAAFDAIRKSPEVQADLKARADRIAAAAGEGHEVDVRIGAHRARASVRTATFDARRSEATDKTLTSALDAGRG
ncbi:MAG: hypothetical protein ACO1ON_12840 [Nocardioides sp.]